MVEKLSQDIANTLSVKLDEEVRSSDDVISFIIVIIII